MWQLSESEKEVIIRPGTHRRDGFPDLVGFTCYYCTPPSIFGTKDQDACKIPKESEYKELGKSITCTHGYDMNGNLAPARGCFAGEMGSF